MEEGEQALDICVFHYQQTPLEQAFLWFSLILTIWLITWLITRIIRNSIPCEFWHQRNTFPLDNPRLILRQSAPVAQSHPIPLAPYSLALIVVHRSKLTIRATRRGGPSRRRSTCHHRHSGKCLYIL